MKVRSLFNNIIIARYPLLRSTKILEIRYLLGATIRYSINIALNINNNNKVGFYESFVIDITIYKIDVVLYIEVKIYLILVIYLSLLLI